MTFIPDTRNDCYYNERFLNDGDDAFVQGFDFAIEQMVNLFAGNLDVYKQELTELCPEGHEKEADEAFATRTDLYDILETDKEIVCAVVKDWAEKQRDDVITACIDSMDDEEYELIKNEVLSARPELKKELYDTRKFAVTSQKITLEDLETKGGE